MVLILFALCLLPFASPVRAQEISTADKPREIICYSISPAGFSVYEDHGTVELDGRTLDLTVFRTVVFGFRDTEKIYSDPSTSKPIRVERDIAFWLNKEHLIEEYSPDDHSVKITKFKGKKKAAEYDFKGSAALDNAVILPFSLRRVPGLAPGWSRKIVLPEEFIVKVDGIEEVSVPAGKFRAFHFTSEPPKFEVWISADDRRLPVKIRGSGGLGYTLSMEECESIDKRCPTMPSVK